jgi:hypothetical protein
MALFDFISGKKKPTKPQDYFIQITQNAFSDLEVVKVIKPKKLEPSNKKDKQSRRSLHDCLSYNQLNTGDIESGGLFFCSFTTKEYKDDIHLFFNIKKKDNPGKSKNNIFGPDINDISYFILDIKPNDEDLRTIVFLSDKREFAESTQADLFTEVSKRAFGFTLDPGTQLLLKVTMIFASDYYVKNLSERCYEDDKGKLKAENVFPEIIEKDFSKNTQIIDVSSLEKETINTFDSIEEEINKDINESSDEQEEEKNTGKDHKASDDHIDEESEEQIIEKSFEHLGTEYVLYNFKTITMNGIPNSRLDGKFAIEDLQSGNREEGNNLFDIIVTQKCSPQRLFNFHVTANYEIDENTIFYYLTYQPSELKEIHSKFAIEVNANNDKKRKIYIFEKLPKINSEDYTHLNLDDMLIGIRFSLLFYDKSKSEKEFDSFLKTCANKTLELYQKSKIVIKMDNYTDEENDSNSEDNNQNFKDKVSKQSASAYKQKSEYDQNDIDIKYSSNIIFKKECPECNSDIDSKDKFCRNCGLKL